MKICKHNNKIYLSENNILWVCPACGHRREKLPEINRKKK